MIGIPKDPHALDAEEVLKSLESSENGLGMHEIENRLKTYGYNELPDPEKKPAWLIFFQAVQKSDGLYPAYSSRDFLPGTNPH